MKLIAVKSFRNVAGRIKLEGALHPSHVEKGQTFEIGTAPTLKELAKTDERNAELAARLISAGVAGEPTPETVARIAAEIEVDRKREAGAKQMDASAALAAAGAQFADLIAQARRLAQPAAPVRAR